MPVVAPIARATIAHPRSVAASRAARVNVTARVAKRIRVALPKARPRDAVPTSAPVQAASVRQVEPVLVPIASVPRADHARATVVRARQARLRRLPVAARVLRKRSPLDDIVPVTVMAQDSRSGLIIGL